MTDEDLTEPCDSPAKIVKLVHVENTGACQGLTHAKEEEEEDESSFGQPKTQVGCARCNP